MQDEPTQRITTYLTFSSNARQAVEFYVSIFKNSEIHNSIVVPGSETLLNASFSLDGQEFMAMDGGPNFTFEPGISLFISCKDQAEVDYYWEKLGAGGEYLQCGWLRDKFGVSWQIIPTALDRLMSSPDAEAGQRVMAAMLKMTKIDIAGLQTAAGNS